MSYSGTVVKWIDDRGFGFIAADGGSDELFVHFSSFGGGSLTEGARVTFDVEKDVRGAEGQFRAANVSGPAVVPRGNRHFGGGGGYGGGGGGRGPRGPSGPAGEPSPNIRIRGLPAAFIDVDLQRLCEPYGKVLRRTVWIHPGTGVPSGFGLVEFDSIDAAQAAATAIHGTVLQDAATRATVEYNYPKGDARRDAKRQAQEGASCCPPGSHGYLAADHDDVGKIVQLSEVELYEVGDGPGGVLILPDVWGWNGGRTRAIADELAALGAKVVVPKILPAFEGGTDGDGLPPAFPIMERFPDVPWKDWAYDQNGAKVKAALGHLCATQGKVGVIGYCFGALVGMKLAAEADDKVVCGVGSHPSLHIEDMLYGGSSTAVAGASKIPWLLQPAGVVGEPGADPDIYDAEGAVFKALEEKYPGRNETIRFPTMHHGFVTRGDIKDGNFKAGEGEEVRKKVTEALDATIAYLRKNGALPSL